MTNHRSLGRIRVLPAVVSEPPYDDELPDPLGATSPALWSTYGSLALAAPPEWRQLPLRLVEPTPSDDSEEDDAEDVVPRTPRTDLPPAEDSARRYVRALLEVLTGDRALNQLARAATPQVYAELETTQRLAGPRSWSGTVRSVHVTEPADGVAEVAAVIARQNRCHAVALRLEGLDGRWVMTALRLGW